MRQLISISLLFVFTSFLFINCAQSSKRTRKPVTNIQISPKNKTYKVGDKLTVNLQSKIKDGSLLQIELYLDGKSIFVSKEIVCSVNIETSNFSVGAHYLKTIATKEDGTTGENYFDFLLLSDVIPQKFGYKVIKSYPHNIENFTEGFEIRNGYLYEGTGQEGSSAIYKTDISSWKVIKEYRLDDQYFGEGITILKGKLYQLTYKTQIGFTRDINTFELLKTWTFKNEQGWGLTNDGKSLIMSDGTEFLYYLDPETFKLSKRIQVCNNKGVIKNLNELEYINGEIWANIWTTDTVVKIDPNSGKIVAEIDLTGILSSNLVNQKTEVDVLNGIAYDNEKNKIYVTGKFWPKLFEIVLVENAK